MIAPSKVQRVVLCMSAWEAVTRDSEVICKEGTLLHEYMTVKPSSCTPFVETIYLWASHGVF